MKKSILAIALLLSGATVFGMDPMGDDRMSIDSTQSHSRTPLPMQKAQRKRSCKNRKNKKYQEAPRTFGADPLPDNQSKHVFAKKLLTALERKANIVEANTRSLERLAALKESTTLSVAGSQFLDQTCEALLEVTANLTLSEVISSAVLLEMAKKTQRASEQKNELDID